jgi:hypothetical protein
MFAGDATTGCGWGPGSQDVLKSYPDALILCTKCAKARMETSGDTVTDFGVTPRQLKEIEENQRLVKEAEGGGD